MIKKLGQVMLYVKNQDESIQFWTEKAGFIILSEENNGHGMRWIEIAPHEDSETSLILHNKDIIAKMSPELNLCTPSLMFFTDDLEKLYFKLSTNGVTVGEIVNMPSGRVFNFADDEENYFAVMERK
ncbi:VOC family protein [Rossellomorea vietnamensis]|uniref:VOC family protein n=1 Tax=Rossellomorea vietnamensis TaxID=218284 RepID=A0A5D4MB77_9BACI|nr:MULTISPECIES: VOC family protein [Bacillaceae]TYR99209.1 VOC family protein [Rossellomorea vietnamensis]